MAKRKFTGQSARSAKRRKTAPRRRRSKLNVAGLAMRLFETKKKETRAGEVAINSLTGWYADAGQMALPQDDTYSGLEGHIIRGKGIAIRGFIKNNASTTMLVRFGVMCVKQGASDWSAFSAGTNVLEGDGGNVNITTASSVQRMTQRFNQDRYRLVRSKLIRLGANNATDGSDLHTFKMWIPLKGYPFRYDGSGTLPTRNVYALFACNVLGNTDESTGDNIELSYTSTFYYVDP